MKRCRIEDHSQHQGQKDVRGDLHFADGVNHWVAGFAPKVEIDVAKNVITVNGQLDRLPIPKPAVANGEDEGGEGKAPDKEVNSEGPGWVNRAIESRVCGEKYVSWIVKESKKDLI